MRGRHRKHARTSLPSAQDGPVFVDSSGRRARLLRRAGAVLGATCVGYAAVLALSFMGGISLSPSTLLPFDGTSNAQGGPGGGPPPGGSSAYAPPSTGTAR
ncbi:hypothetical protein [Streptomyces sp. NBC_01022]|uniref:hypothetical protein n=1 Tax=Streptomyces sp. NBC_01022 TaxID=2903723 RepID=UPI002DD9E071|nr:hypothetical protein [Streptomyces sp. NBC_01022]WRZ85742.1 hypothetical protein OG316_38435 [Streptomyces sp. NBC_01022]